MSVEVVELGSGAQLVVGATLRANALVLRDGGRALLVDAMGGAADAAGLAAYLDAAGLAVSTILVTHYFSDHLAALRLFPAATIVAHAACRATFAAQVNRTAEETGFFVEPTLRLDGDAVLHFGGRELRVFHNPGYTPCMLNVDIPALDLAHAGDTVVGNMVFLAYADLPQLRAALRRLAGLGRRRLIASHGGLAGPESIGAAERYLERLLAETGAGRRPTLEDCLDPGTAFDGAERYYHGRNLTALSRTAPGGAS